MASQRRCDLSISGVRLRPGAEAKTQWAWRRTYHQRGGGEEYRHEIANHYRDFRLKPSMEQLRQRQRRRRRMQLYPLPVRADDSRYLAPMSVHKFPSFAAVYRPARGRQTLCERAPPDQPYNDTVRRIQSATHLRQFQQLVAQQLGHWQRRATKGKVPQGLTTKTTTTTTTTQRGNFDFLQAACDFYEATYLSCIDYLQLVGERNNRAGQQPKEASRSGDSPTAAPEPKEVLVELPCNTRQSLTDCESATTNSTATTETTPAQELQGYARSANILRRIGEKRSFRIGKSIGQTNWSIKVNITPALHKEPRVAQQHSGLPVELPPHPTRRLVFASTVKGLACKQAIHHHQHHHNQQQQQQLKGILKATSTGSFGSMSGPLCIQAINLETPYRNTTKSNPHEHQQQLQRDHHQQSQEQEQQQQQQQHLHLQHLHLIENLQQLQISGDEDGNLPKITVHDYSTQLTPP